MTLLVRVGLQISVRARAQGSFNFYAPARSSSAS